MRRKRKHRRPAYRLAVLLKRRLGRSDSTVILGGYA
jgi:hypothetical protein